MVFVRADSAEGQAIRARAKAKAMEIANNIFMRKGLTVEVHEISPAFLSYTTFQMQPAHQFTIDDSCALVICGFYNNDITNARVLRVQKGREFITDLSLLPIASFAEDKRGVDGGFEKWGVWLEGEDVSLGFRNPTPSSNVDAFPVGYVVIPEGKEDIIK